VTERQADDPGRRSILEAIRRNLAESAPYDAERREHRHPPPASRAEPVESPASPVERFTYALEGVGGRVTVAPDEARAAEAVREILETAGVRRVVISDSPLVERVVGRVALDGLQLERDPGRAVLFDCEMGITGAQWAIA
jgi:L-lactate utilization protein LutB